MEITSVEIHRIEKENSSMIAIANVVIDGCFKIRDIKLIKSKEDEKLFVAMPRKKLPNGEFKDIAHPLNTETRTQFTDAVIAEYNKSLAENDLETDSDTEK